MNEITVGDVTTLLDAVQTAFDHPGGRAHWFRGHSDASWKLVPGVHRHGACKGERHLTTRFILSAPTRYPNCPSPGDFSRWLCLMQHYALPTRLLDWTESPLFAAWFAVSYDTRATDAAIWCLSPDDLNSITAGGHSVALLEHDRVSHLLKPAFLGGDSTDTAIAVLGQDVDLRMAVQQCGFTIHGGSTPLETHSERDQFLRKFVIPEDRRDQLRRELSLLGVRRSMLFPDIENLARELGVQWERRVRPHGDFSYVAEPNVGPESRLRSSEVVS